MGEVTRHAGLWTLEHRFASPWHYLPVEVPGGASSLRVELRYARTGAPPAVLDLGCLSPGGFRGWSGSARESFVISPASATPGYLPGELEPGLWQIMIGLHQVPPEGVRYELTAETAGVAGGPLAESPAAPPPPGQRPRPRPLPASGGRRWLGGDLHAHTLHSDGALTVPELARFAAERGLDYIAVTDHNTVSHHAELPVAAGRYGITMLPGQEVTTGLGHAGVLGATGWIDFRRDPDDWLDAASRGGGLMSVNHPIGGQASWLRAMRRRPPLVEVWHWSWLDLRWTTPLAWWQAWDPAAIPVGGSDWHRPGSDAPPGSPTTWVECPDGGPDAVLDGLRAGRVAISASRDGPVLLRSGEELIAVAADGLTLAGPDGPCQRVRGDLASLPGKPGFHRLLDPAGATLALTP
ncbi:MAG: CehA/McbA family metallohydrolase [Streptosporangiaceae bacterium]|nr:CehA/McbA family metallohydrolase [Streptosporangiaceae bacterium]MBV9853527.1 CehA/McbA family metallohydrolase [Streptosporangiaceae bacterium]